MTDKLEHEKVLTKEITEQFVADPDSVNLREFTTLEDDAAKILSKYEGRLELNGLKRMSDGAAEHLSKHNGELKVLVKYAAFTGEMDIQGLFITTLTSYTEGINKNGRLFMYVADHTSMEWNVADIVQIRSIDQGLIEKLESIFGEIICGENVFEGTTVSEESEDEEDSPRRERSDVQGTITNSIGMKLVPIAAGTFLMGSPAEEEGHSDDAVQHKVTLTKDFYLGMTQVTQAQYKKVMGENWSYFQGDEVCGRDSSEFPVEMVSWDHAVEFCKKLSDLPEEKAAGRVYRLPTEAEWEYACRAGSTTAFSFGDDEELGDYAWYVGNSGGRTHPVARKKPNAWGLYDMHGNVWEWCSDWWGDSSEGAVSDPVGPDEGSYRAYRGGCWSDKAAFCRSAFRNFMDPSEWNNDYGFRVALSSSGVNK